MAHRKARLYGVDLAISIMLMLSRWHHARRGLKCHRQRVAITADPAGGALDIDLHGHVLAFVVVLQHKNKATVAAGLPDELDWRIGRWERQGAALRLVAGDVEGFLSGHGMP